MKKIIVFILTAAMIIGMFTGCSNSTGSDQESVVKDTITFVSRIKGETLDPTSGKSGDHTTFHSLYDTLVKFGADAEILPCLAESWTETDEGMSYIFNLRQDVKFHDGSDFTADDVIYSFDTMLGKPNYASFRTTIGSWEKIDDYKVKFTKTSPYSNLLSVLAYMGYIVSEEAHSPDPATFDNNPVGTGAYKFVTKEADGSITLAVNDNYFGGKPEFANLVIKQPLDASTAVVALENNEVDVISYVPPAQIPIIESNDKLEMVEVNSWYVYELMMMGDTLNKDVNLRKAIFHAIDRDKVITFASEGKGNVSTNISSERIMSDYLGTVDLGGYDVSLAKEYLDKSNYDSNKVFKISITSDEAAIAQAVQADLKEIGIETEIEQLDINDWATKIMGGEVEITITQDGGVTGTPESVLNTFDKTHAYFGKYMATTDEYSTLVQQMKAEKDDSVRKEIVKRGLEIQAELTNSVPLYDTMVNFAYNKEITNITPVSAATNVYYVGDFKLTK